jgi:hypothetical protein
MKHFARLNKHPITFEQFTETITPYVNADLLELGTDSDKHFFRARTRIYLALLTHKGENQLLIDFLAGTSFGCLVECGPTNPESAADSAHGTFHLECC